MRLISRPKQAMPALLLKLPRRTNLNPPVPGAARQR